MYIVVIIKESEGMIRVSLTLSLAKSYSKYACTVSEFNKLLASAWNSVS